MYGAPPHDAANEVGQLLHINLGNVRYGIRSKPIFFNRSCGIKQLFDSETFTGTIAVLHYPALTAAAKTLFAVITEKVIGSLFAGYHRHGTLHDYWMHTTARFDCGLICRCRNEMTPAKLHARPKTEFALSN